MINILKDITTILLSNAALSAVTTTIKPIAVMENTPLPLIIMTRQASVDANNDQTDIYNVTLDIFIYASTYSQTVAIATLVNNELNNHVYGNVRRCKLAALQEDFNDNVFMQNLTYTILSF
jgi:hypothetical protein